MFRGTPDSPPLLVVAFGDRVFGMHARTGQRLWSQETGTGGVPRAFVHGDCVYVLGGALVCLEYATGRILWRTDLKHTFASGTFLVAGDLLFAADVGEVAAFDATTGRMLWHDDFKGLGIGSVALAVPGSASQSDRTG